MISVVITIRLSRFGRFHGPFLVPANFDTAVGRSRRPGRPHGRRGTRLALDAGKTGRTLPTSGTWARLRRAGLPLLGALVLATADAGRALARPQQAAERSEAEQAIDEAAARFRLAPELIRAVLLAESGGRPDAVSPKGAMGLMQLMPPTWRDMRAALALGEDPFRPRDNVLAGAGYLRQLVDRFGSPGYLAAYNAGPGRYQRHLDGVVSLPKETVDYVAKVQLRLARTSSARPAAPVDWRTAGLFVERDANVTRVPGVFITPPEGRRP